MNILISGKDKVDKKYQDIYRLFRRISKFLDTILRNLRNLLDNIKKKCNYMWVKIRKTSL
jgi:hypothetical protein